MYKAEFHVNIDAVVESLDYIDASLSRISSLIESEMYGLVKSVIYDEFSLGCRIANSDDGFPPEFQEHLLNNVENIIPTVIPDGYGGIFVSIDFEQWLGGQDDLTKAFHQGALLEDGTKLWGPYTGQPLKQEDTGIRHEFWEAVRRGDRSVQIEDKNVHFEASWDDTIEQYLNIWGEKSPQWLFIQFGQEEWAPYVVQYDLINNIQEAVNAAATEYLTTMVESTIRIANTYKTAGLDVGYSGSSAQPRVISGTFEVNGKVYRPGRFVPKGGF